MRVLTYEEGFERRTVELQELGSGVFYRVLARAALLAQGTLNMVPASDAELLRTLHARHRELRAVPERHVQVWQPATREDARAALSGVELAFPEAFELRGVIRSALSLEIAFMRAQHGLFHDGSGLREDGLPWTQRPGASGRPVQATSCAVGDVLVWGGEAWRVDPFGFSRVTPHEVPALEAAS